MRGRNGARGPDPIGSGPPFFLPPCLGIRIAPTNRTCPACFEATNDSPCSPRVTPRTPFWKRIWNVSHDDAQWLGNFTDAGGVVHYSFAHLMQDTRSLGIRASYTATPTLSFQLYAAPFVARGEYSNARQLSATPRAETYQDRFSTYAPPTGTSMGFNVLQLRSNNVVRWEFRPGSTLFAVWTHGRDGYDPRYVDRDLHGEYTDLFALHPANTFLLKLAYWLD